jgi:hypothetical protein
MALKLVKENKARVDYGRVDDGAYPARIVQIIDFGKQYETDWKTGNVMVYEDSGEEIVKHKVWINFEFPDELIEVDGNEKPRWYGKEYTVSAHEKSALAALLKAVDPKGVATEGGRNVKGLLGLPAMVTIGSTSSGKAKVSSVSGVPRGMQVGPLANPEVFFDLDEPDQATFGMLPKWMKDRITNGIDFAYTGLGKQMGSGETARPISPKVSVNSY